MKDRSSSHDSERCAELGFEKEPAEELHAPVCEVGEQKRARDMSDSAKPFASFGSFRQRHGDSCNDVHQRTSEAPAKLESSACCRNGGLSLSIVAERSFPKEELTNALVECARSFPKVLVPFWRSSCAGLSSTDLDREEAWERKKAQYLPEEDEEDSFDGDEEYGPDQRFCDGLSDHTSEGICSSDSDEGSRRHDDHKTSGKHIMQHDELSDVSHEGNLHALHTFQSSNGRAPRKTGSFRKKPPAFAKAMRTRSLTDEDMEELRGSIDLGFGFSYNEGCNLTNTLPALELYYAINKNFADARSSPVSPLEGIALLRTDSASSTSSPGSDSWRISSPGDHPSQVKMRLRHWAQAVACSVKQGY